MDTKRIRSLLTEGFTEIFRDPLWHDIEMDKSLRDVVLSRALQKMDRIRQNGPTSLIYPGAVHTRLSHSIGVYHVGRQTLISVSEKTSSLPLSEVGIRSYLAALLLHDIGHFPYAHSLKELSMRTHEELAAEIINGDEDLRKRLRDAGADPGMVAAIIDASIPDASDECKTYRNILSGTLDPDKLDYLNRDAFFSGVPYGTQDNGYIIRRMHIIGGGIAVERKAYSSIESLLFGKYLMYKNVYWHKGVRSATAMIKKAILCAIREGCISEGDLCFKDDYEFARLPEEHKECDAFKLFGRVMDNRLFESSHEEPYDEESPIVKAAKDIYGRNEAEMRLYEALRKRGCDIEPYEAIIDIPEPISFESKIQILNEDGTSDDFSAVTKLFSGEASKRFSSSLRLVRVFTPPEINKETVMEAIKDGIF